MAWYYFFMINCYEKLNEIEELLNQNHCWTNLILGYCLEKTDYNKEVSNIIPAVQQIVKNNCLLLDYLEEMSDEFFKKIFTPKA